MEMDRKTRAMLLAYHHDYEWIYNRLKHNWIIRYHEADDYFVLDVREYLFSGIGKMEENCITHCIWIDNTWIMKIEYMNMATEYENMINALGPTMGGKISQFIEKYTGKMSYDECVSKIELFCVSPGQKSIGFSILYDSHPQGFIGTDGDHINLPFNMCANIIMHVSKKLRLGPVAVMYDIE
jgi:hypothetical protein